MSKRPTTPKEYGQAFRKRTKILREGANLSQPEMAARLGVSPTTYPKYESRSLLPHHLISTFLHVTGGTYEYLFFDAPDKKKTKERDAVPA